MKRYRIYGKLSGMLTGSLLSGNIVGGLLGAMLGHFLFDYKEPRISDCCDQDIFDDHQFSYKANILQSILSMCVFLIDMKKNIFYAEINTIKEYFIEQFRFDLNDIILLDKNIINIMNSKETINIREACRAVNSSCHYEEKLSIIGLLFLLSTEHSVLSDSESSYIIFVAEMLNIKKYDFNAIRSKYCDEECSYYAELGLTKDASVREIKSAYRKLVTIYHPDRAREHYDNEKFQRIVTAYNHLINDRSASNQ